MDYSSKPIRWVDIDSKIAITKVNNPLHSLSIQLIYYKAGILIIALNFFEYVL